MATTLLLLLSFIIPCIECVVKQKKVVVVLELVNGSLVPVVKQLGNEDAAPISGAIVQGIFLVLLFLIGFAGSILLVSTVASSLTLRRAPFNILLLQLGVCCLLEFVFNVVVSIVYVVTSPGWELGSILCTMDSCVMEFTPVVYTLILLNLVIDRVMAVRDPVHYRKRSRSSRGCRTLISITYWIFSLLSVVVILVPQVLKNWPFPSRYSCQVMHKNSDFYGAVSLFICFVYPWSAMVMAMFLIQRVVSKEKKREKKANRNNGNNNRATNGATRVFFLANGPLWMEVRNALCVVAITASYIVLLIPYVLRQKIDQITQNYDFAYYQLLSQPHFESSSSSSTNVTTVTPSESSVPEVIESHLGTHDKILVWMRYLHFAITPIIIFAIHKDVRKKSKEMLCCFRGSTVDNASSPRPKGPTMPKQPKNEDIKSLSSTVPVLFATSSGLHLRLIDEEESSKKQKEEQHQKDHRKSVSNKHQGKDSKSEQSLSFMMEFCDLQFMLSNNDGNNQDPFNNSIQVVRSKQAAAQEMRRQDKYRVNRRDSEVSYPPTNSDGGDGGNYNDQRQLISPSPKKVQFNSQIEEIPLEEFTETVLVDDPNELRLRKKKLDEMEEKRRERRRRRHEYDHRNGHAGSKSKNKDGKKK